MPAEQLSQPKHNPAEDLLEAHIFPSPQRLEFLCGILPELKDSFAASHSLDTGPLAGRTEVTQLPLSKGAEPRPWSGRLHYDGIEGVAILEVPQCALADIDANGIDPYLHFTMSTCSALVAHDRKTRHVVAAHIGLSETQQAEEALRLFKEKDIRPEDIHAIISQGQKQSEGNYFSLEAYLAHGIPTQNCHPFVFEFGDDGGQNGLVEVMAGKDGLLISSFDIPHDQKDQRRIDEASRRSAEFASFEAM